MCMLWIQSMPSRPYGSMHMHFGWNVLSMPTEGCSVCIPIVIINFKVRVLNRTLSHIRLHLPTFLLSVGLLTLIYIDSFIVLARPWSSLPMMLTFSGTGAVSCLDAVCMDGWGFLQVLLVSFSKGLGCLVYVFLITYKLPTLIPGDGSTLFVHRILAFGFF